MNDGNDIQTSEAQATDLENTNSTRGRELKTTEARLAAVRERTERQKRLVLMGGGGLLVLLAVGAVFSVRRTAATPPPSVTIVWPSPQKFGQRTFVPQSIQGTDSTGDKTPYSLATVTIRRGQPFTVQVENAENWVVKAVSDGTTNSGGKITWAPVQDGKLKLFCRPNVGGWKRLFAWALPNYELRVEGLAPRVLADGRQQLTASKSNESSGPIWLTSQITAPGTGTNVWDERALTTAREGLKSTESLAPSSSPSWTLKNAFLSNEPRAAGDDGTYLLRNGSLETNKAVDVATTMARAIMKSAPRASIKFIVHEYALPAGERISQSDVTLRLAFDGTGSRGGWIKHSGETAATSLRWWDAQLGSGTTNPLSPSLPRR